jgi:hypothetical protein
MIRALCLALLAVTLGGCGSEGDSEATREDYLAEGDALCAEAQAEAAEFAQRGQEIEGRRDTITDAELLRQAADLWDEQIEFAERFRDRFADLESPPGDEARVRVFLESIDDGIGVGREIQDVLADGKEPSSELVQSYGRIAARGNTLARAYGFQVCGGSG